MDEKTIIEVLLSLKYPYPSYPKDIEVNEAIDYAVQTISDMKVVNEKLAVLMQKLSKLGGDV